ncbi:MULTISPECIES: BTAD domain-containing putative transcriptional regulator [Streptomyces]|uniref:BTAD domain-containing putative transcriptional regulator n=1 Tax=Streptomyces glycanivorans TaxID=3033808 RepID=A0ABY9JAE3_9ACTN|nr:MULTISPECIES: BTAD domain-containing putative transcriptional regulator [unclassified Streptomyces]TXS19785.1 transcriptional regulator [Streptomyces sp. wa22]WLQ63641.1 BTAD domain-containing putative transcriptional regulator [Streptomyces sp. Alt3]WSQ77027.1 winged helix-turn-helix domain-containing protein [Streptomyces sp. NBC_01213]WSR47685.1 winged helix-turn-helix domain-containing protein [Streptomyces sp. NBC_01201]
MPTTVTTDRPTSTAAVLRPQEREVLSAVGCGLRDGEIAAALAIPEDAVAEHLARILLKLGLRDRTAAVVHAFDCGLVVPGRGPRTRPVKPVRGAVVVRPKEARIQISLLGPLRAWQDGRPLDLGHLRQQAVLAALALGAGRPLSRQELLDDVWGTETPAANVVPVYIYRLRKALRAGGGTDPVIERGPRGYRLAPGAVEVDVARMERLVSDIGKADRAGEPHETVRLCARALELFREEPLAGLPGPLAELERLRLTKRRIAIAQRKTQGLLRLGRDAEAIAELFSLSAAHPLDEPLAAMLMRALHRNGRQADALTVFERTRRFLADGLGVSPSRMLRETHRMILRGDEAGPGVLPLAGSVTGT